MLLPVLDENMIVGKITLLDLLFGYSFFICTQFGYFKYLYLLMKKHSNPPWDVCSSFISVKKSFIGNNLNSLHFCMCSDLDSFLFLVTNNQLSYFTCRSIIGNVIIRSCCFGKCTLEYEELNWRNNLWKCWNLREKV